MSFRKTMDRAIKALDEQLVEQGAVQGVSYKIVKVSEYKYDIDIDDKKWKRGAWYKGDREARISTLNAIGELINYRKKG